MQHYPHQIQVADAILAGKNVILQAPTGAGKTRAALLPFLESWHDLSDTHKMLPPRCIYSVPMRVLAKQFYVEYAHMLRRYTQREGLRELVVKTQTGEIQDDPKLESNLIFATIDQTLSSFLLSPYSLSKRQANLNSGAVISSYLVFDEFHLFDPGSTLPTTLHMLKMLKGITPFVLMTATFSPNMLEALAEQLDAVVIGRSETELAEFAKLPSQNKVRRYHAIDDAMSAERIVSLHKSRSLVVCNQVDRARHLFENIQRLADGETSVYLLHSRFLPDDRNRIEDEIRSVFAKGNTNGSAIVVSTQAIEVGVDISSTILHTELAPANAIIQRAGRCARYEHDEGDVYIYRRAIKDGEVIDLAESVMPYQHQEQVIQKTWDAFAARNGQQFTFHDEQTIIAEAHQEQDQQTINRLAETTRNHRQKMYAVMRGDDAEDARNLIRFVMQQRVVIHDDPAIVAQDPFSYPTFGLHPGTVQKHMADWLERRTSSKQLALIKQNEDEEAAQSNDERYTYGYIENVESGWMAQLLVVHPDLATYDPVLGFIADTGGDWIATYPDNIKESKDRGSGHKYRLETYQEHIKLVYEAFEDFWPESQWAAHKLEVHFGWPEGSIAQAARLAVLLHDVGKLSWGWQNWVKNYQKALFDTGLIDENNLPQSDQAYAHTDFRSEDAYREVQKSVGKRPWHAVEGALATSPIIAPILNNNSLTRAALSAIMRHHAPFSDSYQTFHLIRLAEHHVQQTMTDWNVDLSYLLGVQQAIPMGHPLHNVISEPGNDVEDEATFLAYLLIVRALRRSDSEGTQRGAKPS